MNKLIYSTLSLASIVFVALAFQNCSGVNSNQDYVNLESNPNDIGQIEDDLSDAPNPIDEKTTDYKNKCTFFMEGSKGYRWKSERYVPASSDCERELRVTELQNPNARIYKHYRNFVYDPIGYEPKWKCTYHFLGANGAQWIAERYTESAENCEGSELDKVATLNPRADVEKVFTAYTHDMLGPGEKWKCVYHITGEKGAYWTSERYALDSDACTLSELEVIRSNNPKAYDIRTEVVYVRDIEMQ